MSINVNTIALPPTVHQQVVTAVLSSNNENATKQAVLDPTGLLLAYKNINKSFGSIGFSNNATVTTITTANTFVLVQNSALLLNTLSQNFALTAGATQASSRLTYQGATTCNVRVTCTSNVFVAGSNNQNISIQLFLNGVAVPNTVGKSWLQTAPHPQNQSVTTLLTMNTNDYVELFVTNNTANNNVTVTDMTVDAVSLH